MLSKAIILATIAMLILIFLKVPVFVSMMSGAMVYFVWNLRQRFRLPRKG